MTTSQTSESSLTSSSQRCSRSIRQTWMRRWGWPSICSTLTTMVKFQLRTSNLFSATFPPATTTYQLLPAKTQAASETQLRTYNKTSSRRDSTCAVMAKIWMRKSVAQTSDKSTNSSPLSFLLNKRTWTWKTSQNSTTASPVKCSSRSSACSRNVCLAPSLSSLRSVTLGKKK